MEQLIEDFKKRVEIQSAYQKYISKESILKLYDYFARSLEVKDYHKSDTDFLDVALKFYYTYFKGYYDIIYNGLRSGNIIISSSLKVSYTLPEANKTYIRVNGDEKDLFIMIHEMAHFVDISSHPHIIEYHRSIYSEVVPFFVERIFEQEMSNDYQRVIGVRKTNRNTTANKLLEIALLMLKYEEYYKEHGDIDNIINIEEIKKIMRQATNNTVNTVLRYPIANIYSAYMLLHGIALHGKLNITLDELDFDDIINNRKVKELIFHG